MEVEEEEDAKTRHSSRNTHKPKRFKPDEEPPAKPRSAPDSESESGDSVDLSDNDGPTDPPVSRSGGKKNKKNTDKKGRTATGYVVARALSVVDWLW